MSTAVTHPPPLDDFGTQSGMAQFTPTIYLVNEAKTDPKVSLPALATALQAYVTKYVGPVWGSPAKIVVADSVPAGGWGLILMDDSDQADALAYHWLTADGFPQSLVFVKTILADGYDVPSAAAHEVAEMVADPDINLCYEGPLNGQFYAGEVCDPVESDLFLLGGLAMSNFVFPSWFDSWRKPGSVRFDLLGKLTKPFTLDAGGYCSIYSGGHWSQQFGSETAREKFQRMKAGNPLSRPMRRVRRSVIFKGGKP